MSDAIPEPKIDNWFKRLITWFKNIWKLLIEFLAIILVLFLIFSPMAIVLKIVLIVISHAVIVLLTLSSLSII